MPEYEDRLGVELQYQRRTVDAQDTARLRRKPIAIINRASDGSRGLTHVRTFRVRDHAQRHDFGRRLSNQQRCRY